MMLPDGWTYLRLGDCGRWLSGGTPRTTQAEFWGGEIPLVTSGSLLDFYIDDAERRVTEAGVANGTRLVPANSIIFVVRGMSLKTEFRVGITRRSVAFGQDCKALVARADINPLFLAFAIRAEAPRILGMVDESSHGTGRLATDRLKEIMIPIPPREEQDAVASMLGTLEDRSRSNERIVRLCIANAEGEYAEATSGANVTPAYDVLQIDYGAAFSGRYFNDTRAGRALIRIRDLKTREPQLWTTETLPNETVIRPGDVLVGMDAEFESCVWLGPVGVLNQRVCRVRPRTGVSRTFALCSVRPGLEFCERAKSGTTVIHLNKADIDRFKVPELRARAHDALSAADSLLDRAIGAANEGRALDRLREMLLPNLVNGRMRIGERRETVGASV